MQCFEKLTENRLNSLKLPIKEGYFPRAILVLPGDQTSTFGRNMYTLTYKYQFDHSIMKNNGTQGPDVKLRFEVLGKICLKIS